MSHCCVLTDIFYPIYQVLSCSMESGRRSITVWPGGYAVANQVPLCWNSDFDWTPMCVHMYLAICVLSFAFAKLDVHQTFQGITVACVSVC
jgi:hypothetical protein